MKKITVELTPLEASVLLFVAGMAGDDIDHLGLSGSEKAAYPRIMDKLRVTARGNAAVRNWMGR